MARDDALPGLTRATQERYDRLAGFYGLMEKGVEKGTMANRRAKLWSLVQGPRVLEVGVGTGKNIEYYRPGLQVTAVDLSPRMLERARRRAAVGARG